MEFPKVADQMIRVQEAAIQIIANAINDDEKIVVKEELAATDAELQQIRDEIEDRRMRVYEFSISFWFLMAPCVSFSLT